MTVETFKPESNGVTLTDTALKHITKQLEKSQAAGVRVSVKESGCSGFKYVVDFAEPQENDHIFSVNDQVKIFVAEDALKYVQGMELDFTTEGLNSTIKFNNPNAKAHCGCGESFAV